MSLLEKTSKRGGRILRWIFNTTVLLAAVGWLGAGRACAGDEVFHRDRIVFPFAPAAMVDGPAALRFNPAALSFERELGLNYYHTFSDSSSKGDDALYLSWQGFGFATEWLGSGDVPRGRSYTIGVSTGTDGPLNFGSTYEWRSSDDPRQNKSHLWSHGMTWRPGRRLSLAAVVHNYNRMKVEGARTDAEFVYSAAVNLMQGRLILGGDWYQTTSQNLAAGRYRLAGSFEVSDGLILYADIDKHRNFFLGGRFNLTNLFVGTHTRYVRDDGYRGGVFYAGLMRARRRPAVRGPREILHLRLSGEIPDRKPARTLLGSVPMTTLEWVSLLDKAAGDPSIGAVVLTIDRPQSGGARLDEIRRAVLRVRDSGKYVIAYLDGAIGNGEYFLASAADAIVVPPVSTLNVVGLRAEVTFLKRLLDKLGIKADLEHVGKYKSASDLLTRTAMSEAHREALNRLLDDIDSNWVGAIAAGRGVPASRVRAWINHGPYVSVDARDAGMVDTVAHPDELDDLARSVVGRHGRIASQGVFVRRAYHRRRWGPLPEVAVVFASGSIVEGEDRDHGWWGPVMGSATVTRAIRRAREDRRVKAIVLRVNSGGGSVFASDAIWREVARTVGVKPIVVSFGDVAASGGYYIACAADSIFALPGTITGSIGVISGKLDLSGLYDKIGFDREVLTRGRFADLYGSDRSFNEDERAVIRDQMMRAYDRFVTLVAEGRNLSPDSVRVIGQGRVWSGVAARRNGLVDRFTDLRGAVRAAARMAGVEPGQPVRVLTLPERPWRLFDTGWPSGLVAASGAGSMLWRFESLLEATGLADGGPAYEAPYTITVR